MKIYPLLIIIVFSLIACAPKQGVQNSPALADSARADYQMGMAAKDRVDYEGAWKALTRAAELAPDNPRYLNEAGGMAYTLGRYDTAIEYYEKALAVNLKTYGPDHPTVATLWNNLGLVWQDKGEVDRAIEYYEKALASDLKTFGSGHPAVARAWNNLGGVWQNTGEYDKAIQYFEKALASDLKTFGPDHPDVALEWNNLGGSWQAKGDAAKAREYFDKALAVVKKAGLEHRVKLVEENLRSLPPEK